MLKTKVSILKKMDNESKAKICGLLYSIKGSVFSYVFQTLKLFIQIIFVNYSREKAF